MSELLNAALDYVGNGWSVIPMRGKRPLVKWKEYQDSPPDPETVKGWFRDLKVTQLGLALGAVASGLWVMDADGPEAVAWAEANAPKTAVKVKTFKGTHYYYRAPEGERIKNGVNVLPGLFGPGNQIDVRGHAGLSILPPSAHSKGGKYEWVWEGDVPFDDIPFWSPPFGKPNPGGRNSLFESAGPAPFPPRGGKKGNMNLRLGGLGVSADLLESKNFVKGERNHNLTRYVGKLVSEGYSRKQIELLALGWDRLNAPPQTNESVLATVGSVISIHESRHGAAVPLDEPDDLPSLDGDEEDPPAPVDDVPKEFTRPGGTLGMLIDHIEKTNRYSHPLFSLGAGLCYLGTLVGQKVMTETGLRTNMYVIGLAKSGTGKDSPLRTLPILTQKLFGASKATEIFGPTKLASTPALLPNIMRRNCQLFLIDELGDLMSSVNNKMSHRAGLSDDLKELYSKVDRNYEKAYSDVERNIVIPWHHVSVYATGTSSAFWSNLTIHDTVNGFISRALVLSLNIAREKNAVFDEEIDGRLADDIGRLYRTKLDQQGDMKNASPKPKTVPLTPEAKNYVEAWDDMVTATINGLPEDKESELSIYNRLAEHANKIALIHAVSRAHGIPETIGLEDVTFACRLLDWNTPRIIKLIEAKVAHNPTDALCRRIIEAIEKKGKVSKKFVFAKLRQDCTLTQINEAVYMLEEADQIKRKIVSAKGKTYDYFYRTKPSKKGEP